jgi:inosose dehydratase
MVKANSRRNFIASIPVVAAMANSFDNKQKLQQKNPISCNTYNWVTFYAREGKNWGENWDESIAEFAKTGIKAFEPSLNNVAESKTIWTALKKHNIAMPSVYIGSVLHNEFESEKNINEILAIANVVKEFGTKIIVTNPNPIKWGGSELKNDSELIIQAQNLNKLGAELRKKDIKLAYHTHDVELKAGAREFHHILQNTSPENLSFCMDVHWIYRGSGNSNVAVFDVLKMYGKRIVELHLRQSINGVWSETFGEGDIDYHRFAKELKRMNIHPHLVIEQCVEEKSAITMNGLTAHIVDLKEVISFFAI